jgi:glycosyltransferase involved in cell wall biosynthesis
MIGPRVNNGRRFSKAAPAACRLYGGEVFSMRITFVLDHANLSGGVRVIAGYTQRLRERGHDVTAVSRPWEPPGRMRRATKRIGRWLHLLDPRDRAAYDPSHFDGLDVGRRIIGSVRPITERDVPDADVVIATWWRTAPWVMAFGSRKGAKLYFMQDYGAPGQPIDELAATWRLPIPIITISHFLIDLMRRHGRDADVTLLPNGVDLDVFHAEPRRRADPPTFGTLYSTAPQKGTDIVLEAFDLARRRRGDLRLQAFGAKDPALHPQLPLPAGMPYARMATDETVRAIYASCDGWLFGSRIEGFGLPLLEAMACRTPVIATPAGAAPELVEESGGRLVPHDDPQAMAEAILDLAGLDDSTWRALSERAWATARAHTWERSIDLFEEALETAVSGGAGRAGAVPAAAIP